MERGMEEGIYAVLNMEGELVNYGGSGDCLDGRSELMNRHQVQNAQCEVAV